MKYSGQTLSLTNFPKLPPRGSLLYYPYRKLDLSTTQYLMSIENLRHQCFHALSHIKEVSILQTKLFWWREDIRKLPTHTSQHPILAPFYKTNTQTHAILQNFIEACLEFQEHQKFNLVLEPFSQLEKLSIASLKTLQKTSTMITAEPEINALAIHNTTLHFQCYPFSMQSPPISTQKKCKCKYKFLKPLYQKQFLLNYCLKRNRLINPIELLFLNDFSYFL